MSESQGSSSASSASSASSGAGASKPAPVVFGDNKGIRFHISTGGSSWACTLQDRSV